MLRDGAIALWPLTAGNESGTAGLGPRGRPAQLFGLVPHPTSGPVLSGVRRLALTFHANSRFITPLTAGLGPGDAWTVEMWVRADGCSGENERLGGTSSRGPRGRQGLDLFHYPSNAAAPCRLGAELWSDNAFLGGCAAETPPIAGRWQHFAVTYGKPVIHCWTDGAATGRGVLRPGGDNATTPFGIAGSGNRYSAALATASLSEVAVYPFALTRDALRRHASPGSVTAPHQVIRCPACDGVSRLDGLAPGWGSWRRCAHCSLAFVHPLALSQPPTTLYEAAYRGDVKEAGMCQYQERLAYRDVIVGDLRRPELGLWTEAFPLALQWFGERTPEGATLLELGCAFGYFLTACRSRGFDAVGLDVAATVVDLVRSEGFRAWHGELSSLPPSFVTPAAVASFFVLHHLADPLAWLCEVRARFPDAVVALAVHGHDDAGRPSTRYSDPPRTLTRWSGPALRAVLERAGYDVEIVPCIGGPRPGLNRARHVAGLLRRLPRAWLMVKRVERRLRPALVREPKGSVLLALATPRHA